MGSRWPVAVAFAAGFWLAAGQAHGQSVPPLRGSVDDTQPVSQLAAAPALTVTPLQDPIPAPRRKPVDAAAAYAPTGIRLGGITLYPTLGIGGVATSNVRQSSSAARADVGLRLRPGLTFASDWSRHSWTGAASLDMVRYLNNPSLKTDTANASTALRLDIRHDTRVELDASYARDQTGLENSQIPATAIGTRTDQTFASEASLIHDFGPLEARLKGGVSDHLFGDVALSGGGSENNSDRNFVELSVALRATYTDPPVFKPYVEVTYDPRIYDQTFDRGGLRRSSQGYAAAAGVVIDRGPIWQGDIALTYLARNYDDPALATANGLGLTGSLTWSPGDLTRIVTSLGTSLSDSVGSTSSASRGWTGRTELMQSLSDNVDGLAGAGVTIEQASGGYDLTYDVGLGLQWKLGPSLVWTAAYDYKWLEASVSSRNYNEHRFTAGLTISR